MKQQTSNSKTCLRLPKLFFISLALMATLCILSVSPREALAQGDSLSSDLEITIKSQDGLVGMPSPAALIDSVLDTYSYFYCYSDASHDNPLMYPTYRTITFKKGYSRIYPDECLSDQTLTSFPCPSNYNKRGMLKTYRCRYSTY